MKKFVRLLAMTLAMMMLTVPALSALAEATDAPATETAAADASTETAATSPEDVMAVVNGKSVTRAKVDQIATNLTSSYSSYGYDTSDATLAALIQQYALDYAVQLELMDQKAVELGFDQFTDEEKAQIESDNAASWSSIVDQYVTAYGGLAEDATDEDKEAARVSMLATLEAMGYTEATMLENAYENAKYDKVEAEMVKDAAVTDEEIQAAFDEKVATDEASYKDDVGTYEYMTQYYGQTSYYMPEGYRGITHILLKVDDALLSEYQSLTAKLEEQQDAADGEEATTADTTADAATTTDLTTETPVTQEQVDAAYQAILDSVQPTIDEINQKLADGTPFADLVAEYGTDQGMQTEPYKTDGYSVHLDSVTFDPAFVKAAFSVSNIGDISEPVVGNYGVHIVCYVRDVPSGAVDMTDEIKDALREQLLSSKENEAFNATMESWKAATTITYSDEAQAMIDAGNAAMATDETAADDSNN